MTELDRRGLLKAACVGCAAVGLAACGGSSTAKPSGAGSPAAGGSAAGTSPTADAGPAVIAKLADVPVGGSFAARAPSGAKIVLARPSATTVVAFSSTCTHQGCTVEPNGKKLSCPCHGSEFDAFTGKNIAGPAPTPLPSFAVKISGTDVVQA